MLCGSRWYNESSFSQNLQLHGISWKVSDFTEGGFVTQY